MRKWFSTFCSECGHEGGYWEDVTEGPETPEQYENRMRHQDLIRSLYGGIIQEQLKAHKIFTKVTDGQTK